MTLPSDAELDEMIMHLQNNDPDYAYYNESFSWNHLHHEKVVTIQSVYRGFICRRNLLRDALQEVIPDPLQDIIPTCEYKKCGELLVMGQERFCNMSCARRFAVSHRHYNKENASTPKSKKKRCSICNDEGHNKTTCKTVQKLQDITNMENELQHLRQENSQLKNTVCWYQNVLQKNMTFNTQNQQ